MSGGPHTAAGIATGIGGAYVTGMENVDAAVFIVAAVFAAGLPDSDHKLPFVTHRGVTHRLITALVLAGLVAAACSAFVMPSLAVPVGVGFLLGYLSHLVLDMMTPTGLKVLGPFKQRRYWVLPKGMRFYVFKQRRSRA